MLKKSASFVLASSRSSTYGKEYASPLRSLRPRWAAFLTILRGILPSSQAIEPLLPSGSKIVFQQPANGTPPKAVPDGIPFRACTPFLLACLLVNLPALTPALAVTMTEDPKGFEGIPWGASLSESSNFTVVYADDRVKEYRLQQEPLLLGTVPVQSMKFSTLDGKFARVTVRYQGDQRHETMLLYLQSRYGPLDLTPGQTMAGTNQQYNWRGADTEVNLTYDGKRETGVIFFESRALGARLAEVISGF